MSKTCLKNHLIFWLLCLQQQGLCFAAETQQTTLPGLLVPTDFVGCKGRLLPSQDHYSSRLPKKWGKLKSQADRKREEAKKQAIAIAEQE